MKMNLSVKDCNKITLMRPAQRGLFVALTDFGLSVQEMERWRNMMWAVARSPVHTSYHFRTLSGRQPSAAITSSWLTITVRSALVPIPGPWI